MTLNYVTLVLDLYDGQGNPVISGAASLVPSAQLADTADSQLITQAPVPGVFRSSGAPMVKLLATDNGALAPPGWAWTISFSGVTLGATDVLTIDTDSRACYLNGGYCNADLGSAWWVLQPGPNTLELGSSAAGDGANFQAVWSSAWL